ncbi:MAG TPA: DinB family protein [bacterium]|nr:DinB family protein [bacterium]
MDIAAAVRLQLERSHERVKKCLADLSPEETRRSPLPTLSPVVWQIGHIAFYDGQYAQKAGGAGTVPVAYEGLFKAGTGGQAGYPPIGQIWDVFDKTHSALLRIAAEADLGTPVEGQMYADIGGMLIFSSVHRTYHIGKMTTLRALLAKPVLFGPPLSAPRP